MQIKELKVIVSCSGKFHAFALAEQLHKHNVLAELFTSYSSIKNPKMLRFAKRIDRESIPKEKIKTNLLIAIGIKLFNNPYFWNNLFDKWVAFKIKKSDADIFIGWSGMSLRSIRAAKKSGMITIIERGSSHIQIQNELLKEEYKKFGLDFSINQNLINKECLEYEEVDYISIPSNFVLNSFIKKGVSIQKLLKNNYGSVFKQGELIKTNNEKKFRVLYLGTSKIRKGLIYLYEALNLLKIPITDFEVWFIGSVNKELTQVIEKYKQVNWIFWGHKNQHDLPKLISQCDVAVHPSIEEGLSMVIPQLMSCSVPVIATTNTGGSDLIEDGVNGFIIPIRSPERIKTKLEFLFFNPHELDQMKKATQKGARLSWDDYGNRYMNNLIKIENEQKS